MPVYPYQCHRCRRCKDVTLHMIEAGRCITCPCGGRMRRHFIGPAYSSKDKLWEFTTTHLKPGTTIRSKRQWQRFLKTHKLTDDISTREIRDGANSHALAQRKRAERSAAFKRTMTRYFERKLPELGITSQEVQRDLQRLGVVKGG